MTLSIAAKTAMLLALAIPGMLSAQERCSVLQLRGDYAFLATGSAATMGQITMIGVESFDGDGNTVVSETASFGGMIVKTTLTGTYTVNADCTGTAKAKFPDGSTGNLSFVITDMGKTVYFMEADSGVNLGGTMTRQ